MTYARYAKRAYVHPSRKGERKTLGSNLWAVLHTSEGSEFPNSAEALAQFLGQPATATNVASYHDIFDTDQVIPAVEHHVVAYAAGGGNARGIHGCFPGRAGQTREQWLDSSSRAMIRQAAAWLCDLHDEAGITMSRLSVAQVKASVVTGVCDHGDISDAFKKSNHWDVGDGFPWDVLWQDVAALLEPEPEGPDEVLVNYVKHKNHPAEYAQYSNGTKVWIPDGDAKAVYQAIRPGVTQTMPNDAWMNATGAIVGPIPDGVNGFGIPL